MRTFHQFHSHLWHVLSVWCVRWSFAVMRAFSIWFLLSFVPMRPVVLFCFFLSMRTERKQKIPVIYINRFLLGIASRARHLTFDQWFYYWFHHFNEFQTIFVVVVDCLRPSDRNSCAAVAVDATDAYGICALWTRLFLIATIQTQPPQYTPKIERILYIYLFSMKNY